LAERKLSAAVARGAPCFSAAVASAGVAASTPRASSSSAKAIAVIRRRRPASSIIASLLRQILRIQPPHADQAQPQRHEAADAREAVEPGGVVDGHLGHR